MKSHHTGRHLPSDSDSSLHSKCFLSHKSSGLHTAREHLETAFPATSCLHGVPRAKKERPQVAPCAHRDTTHSPVPELVCPFLSPLSHMSSLFRSLFGSTQNATRREKQCSVCPAQNQSPWQRPAKLSQLLLLRFLLVLPGLV